MMAAQTTATDSTVQTVSISNKQTAQWPLSFQLRKVPPPVGPPGGRPRPVQQYWNHTLYRGPGDEPVQVFYSTTKQQSEELAQKFLQEPVLGFDGEWCSWRPNAGASLKSAFSLVQVASEDKIGLFHIARHDGEEPEDLIAPSLRKIIESPDIIKTGVNIKGADFSRLRQHFKLNPQGGLELSDLHRMVVPTSRRGLVAMAKQVEHHLGLPLAKGDVRTSNWTRPLNARQKLYAAADAYAGFMLYHCMNAKRITMEQPLPQPVCSSVQRGKVSPSEEVSPTEEVSRTKEVPKRSQTTRKEAKKRELASLDTPSQELFQRLKSSRIKLALAAEIPAYCVASDKVLRSLAQARPTSNTELAQIPGIRARTIIKYGPEWISIISEFLSENADEPAESYGILSEKTQSDLNSTGSRPPQSPSQSYKQPAPLLHTGVSFQMGETALRNGESPKTDEADALEVPALNRPHPLPASPERGRKRRHREISSPASNKQEPASKELKVARNTTDRGEPCAKQPQNATDVIDYFSDQDEEALWTEAFDNLEAGKINAPR